MQINTDSLVRAFENNPTGFIAAVGGLLLGIGKIITAVGESRGSHAYARQVNYRIRNKK